MIRPSARWCAVIALSLLVEARSCPAQDTDIAARAAAAAVLEQFGSSDSIRRNASLPLTSGDTQLSTIDGTASASAQISTPSSSAFLTLSVLTSGGGDLIPVLVQQDLNFDGNLDYSYEPPFPVSGICANGIISCDAGTWNNCRTYAWASDNTGRVTLQTSPMNTLAGCYCVNRSCGRPGNLPSMLKDLGGAVVAVVQEQKSGYTVSRVELTSSMISYYGQDNSGSADGTVPQTAYFNRPSSMNDEADAEAARQTTDPDSYYSMLTTSFSDKGTTSDVHSCTISRSVPIREVNLDDIILPVGGTGAVQMCGPDCIRLVLGRQGNNYWNGNCTVYEEKYRVYVNEPDMITQATLIRAIWDDYIQVWIGGSKVYNGPNENFPPETAGDCELSTSWNMGLNRDVTSYFRQAGVVDTRIRVSVTGGGEGYAFVEVRVDDLCTPLDDVITDSCRALEADSNCRLQEETIDGVRTWQSFNPTGSVPPPGTRTISASNTCSMDITRDWWLKERTYRCARNNEFDFTDAGRRADTITASLDGNTPTQTSFEYNDARKDEQTGSWTMDDQTVSLPEIEPRSDCELVCKTRRPVHDSQAALTGVSTDYQNSPVRYDIFYHVCDLDENCPAGPGEVIVDDCQCLNEFAEAASAMMVLDEAARDMTCTQGGTPETGDCQGEIKIFVGQGKECLENGWDTSFFDCCDDSEGNFLTLSEHCPEASIETVQAKQAGETHYIGTYCKKEIEFVGCVQDAQVYCVFNSKLARIIHEQGRIQLQQFNPRGNWGSARSPNCGGFTPEEFQMLDFSRIDLSEVFGDIEPLPVTQMQDNVHGAINDFQNGVQ